MKKQHHRIISAQKKDSNAENKVYLYKEVTVQLLLYRRFIFFVEKIGNTLPATIPCFARTKSVYLKSIT